MNEEYTEDANLQEWMLVLEQDQRYIDEMLQELDESRLEFIRQVQKDQDHFEFL